MGHRDNSIIQGNVDFLSLQLMAATALTFTWANQMLNSDADICWYPGQDHSSQDLHPRL